MSRVFTEGMSRPDSMIEEAARTSYSRRKKAHMVSSSSGPLMRPCAMAMRAPGRRALSRAAASGRLRTRLCTKNACPPRESSASMAETACASS